MKKMSAHVEAVKKILSELGEDPNREGLIKTPQRFLDSLSDLTSGYTQNIDELLNNAFFDEPYNEMVIVRDIEFHSLCEHHLLPFYGYCHVGYIPEKKVIGLSKIPRIVDMFAKRLQVQERMTNQISEILENSLQAKGVGVIIEASHLCMTMRGVAKQNSFAITSSMRGCFLDIKTRQEFMSHIQSKSSRN